MIRTIARHFTLIILLCAGCTWYGSTLAKTKIVEKIVIVETERPIYNLPDMTSKKAKYTIDVLAAAIPAKALRP